VEGSRSNCGVLLSGCAELKDIEVVSTAGVDTSTGRFREEIVGSLPAVTSHDELLVFVLAFNPCTALQKSVLQLVWIPKQWRGAFS